MQLYVGNGGMRKEELEKYVEGIRIEQEVTRRVKFRCIAFWSTIMGFVGMVGSWASGNIGPIKAGFKAFWEAWLKNV